MFLGEVMARLADEVIERIKRDISLVHLAESQAYLLKNAWQRLCS
jgi:hypothetical protein